MDMKRILQALDGASTKPVEGASDMAKFLKAVDNASKPETLTEGANPHKVSLPVQMAMQHYQKPQVEKKKRPALIDKYFKQVEEEIVEEKRQKRQIINQYASTIAQRVLMKESFNPKLSPNPGFKPGAGPGIQSSVAEADKVDSVSMDVPLMIRMFEYAREDAKTDMDLHDVAERMIALANDGRTLTMDDYDEIVGNHQSMDEARKIKPKRKTDPCWSDYHQVGMQKKDGRMVPKCVPRVSKKDK